MDKKYLLLIVAMIPLLLLGAILPNLPNFESINQEKISASTQVSDYHLPEWIFNTTVDINVVFVGFEANSSVITTVNDSLAHNSLPTIANMPHGGGAYFGANYTLDINYINAPLQMAVDYFNFIDNRMEAYPAPSFLVDYDPGTSGQNVGLMNADVAESWLNANTTNYSGLENVFDASYTLFILDSYSEGLIGYYRYYYTGTTDPTTEVLFYEHYMVSWGGHNRFYFMDLASGPTESGSTTYGEPVNATTFKPMWDFENEIELSNAIAEYVDESIALLFLPGYLYIPNYSLNYVIQYLFVDATSDDSVLPNYSDYFNASYVLGSYTDLIPYTNWYYNFSYVDVDEPHLTELEAKIRANPDGSGGYELLNYTLFDQNYVDSLFGSVDVNNPIYVRSIIVAYDEATYINEMFWGLGLPWGALCVTYKDMPIERNAGITNLAIHENGHVFGLRHPHDGYDYPQDYYPEDEQDITDWLYDFQPTPMTYLDPIDDHGCQRSFFNELNKDSMDRGHVLDLYNETYYALDEMATILESKGYTTLPTNVQEIVDEIMANLSLCKIEFEKMDYYNETSNEPDAISYAFFAWNISDDAVSEAENTIAIPEFSKSVIFLIPVVMMIPVYIKKK